MNRHSSFHLLHALAEMGSHDQSGRKQESSDIRFTYMDAANSLHPVLWVTRQRDVLLLDAIHKNWSSGRLWRNIAEQTSLLALHHDQLESDQKERQARALEVFGACLAILVLPTAAADVFGMFPEHYFAEWTKVTICAAALILLCLIIAGVLRFSRSGAQKSVSCVQLLQALDQRLEKLAEVEARKPTYPFDSFL
jgi:hypothetical protein